MEQQRVDKILSNMGFCSRREATKAAKSGYITINGQKIKDASIKVDPEIDIVCLQGQRVNYQKYTYLMLNKKAGYITATEDIRQPTVLDLLPEREQKLGLFAAGRLDKDTEGLLILTNDGGFAHNIMSPRHHIPKVYYAEIEGELTPDIQIRFQEGLVLSDGYRCMPAQIDFLSDTQKVAVNITICEGKFHQVKRMIEVCGGKITYLKRIRIGTLKLPENLQIGAFCEVSKTELEGLKQLLDR